MKQTHDQIRGQALDACVALHNNGIDNYAALIAAAIMSGQHMGELTVEEKSKFTQFATDIQELMAREDEARFCLYDYLDACVNGDRPWYETADELAEAWDKTDEAKLCNLSWLFIQMAEHKRQTYSI